MNKDTFEGHFKEIKGKIKEKWGKLTDDDLVQINGKKEQLIGRIQQKYGTSREKVQEEVTSWLDQFDWYRDEPVHAGSLKRNGQRSFDSPRGSDSLGERGNKPNPGQKPRNF